MKERVVISSNLVAFHRTKEGLGFKKGIEPLKKRCSVALLVAKKSGALYAALSSQVFSYL
jgi:hypothetical protein